MRAEDVRDVFERIDAQPSVQFSDVLLAQLRVEYLRTDAELPTLEPVPFDVLDEEPGVIVGLSPERPNKRRTRRRVAIIAAVAAAAVATAVFVRTENDRVDVGPPAHQGSVPAPTTTVPLVAPVAPAERLPAEGATLSTPETGEVVAAAAHIHRGSYRLYADGRLIRISDADYPGRGFVEQRLSPAGVAAVRQAFLATGMFDPGQPATEVEAPPPLPGGCMCVRDDDGRLLARTDLSHGLDPHDVDPALEEVLTYFEELESRIPEDGWVDREIEHYAAAKYSISFVRRIDPNDVNTNEALDANAARALLPAPAAELLAGQEPRTFVQLGADKSAYPGESSGFSPNAFVVPTDVARAFAKRFPEALAEGSPAGPAYGFWWTIAVTEPEPTSLTIMLWPMLPDGDVAMWGG
jgi:hypothetical protein